MGRQVVSNGGLFALFIASTLLLLLGCGEKQAQTGHDTGKISSTDVPAPAYKVAMLTAQINSAPLFESQGTWGAGYLVAKGKGPGVVVGPGGENPNVFAQQFPAQPGDQFKLVARASSVDKTPAKGRFQVNWITRESKFISTSIKAFDVTTDEKQFEHIVVAPSGAAAGTLYVVGDGPDSVVRYTEMRVLGKEPAAKAN